MSEHSTSRVHTEDLTLAYATRQVVHELTMSIPDNSFTVIVGANACGKSTVLRAMARLLAPVTGASYVDGKRVHAMPTKQVARTLGLLPQSPSAPEGITVLDLVYRGRFPHQGVFRQAAESDERAVHRAMAATGVSELAQRPVDELSGGQRQRVWLATALAQETPILLLDEPTTFLDIAHQIDVLNLCAALHADGEHTLVAVLHDLNQACRYATHLIAMKEGTVVAAGDPVELVTAELVEEVYGLRCRIIDDPETHRPLIVPLAGTTLARLRGEPAA